jgi:hypothetical protein
MARPGSGIMLSDSFYADMQERGNATFPCTPSPKPTTTPNKNRLAARTGKKLGCGNDARWNPWKSPIPTSSPLLPALGNPATDAGCPHSHSHNDDGLQKTEPTSNQDQHQQQNHGRLHRRVDTPVIQKGDTSNVISKGASLLSVDMGT